MFFLYFDRMLENAIQPQLSVLNSNSKMALQHSVFAGLTGRKQVEMSNITASCHDICSEQIIWNEENN